MPKDIQPFTEQELEALAREQGKPVRKGFENDVLQKVRSRQPENESERLQDLENTADSAEKDTAEKGFEI